MTINPPEGVPQPEVDENWGTTTSINNDVHIRVWTVQIPADGTYDVVTDGQVSGYINPQLAFGKDSSNSTLAWVFGGLFVVGLLELTAAIIYAVRSGKRASPAPPSGATFSVGDLHAVRDPYTPTDDGIRIEALKNLAAPARFGRADRAGVRGRETPDPRRLAASAGVHQLPRATHSS